MLDNNAAEVATEQMNILLNHSSDVNGKSTDALLIIDICCL
jgi:hypothetical protein